MSIYCDTHVHCYQFSEFEALLDYAYENAVSQSFSSERDHLVLFFTGGLRDRIWPKLSVEPSLGGNGWTLDATQDPNTIVAKQRSSERLIYLMAARQINSAERLEFLVLGYDGGDEDGKPANTIIERFSEQFVVICPWGVGKWLFGRGKLLSELVQKYSSALYLGDNGGRPKFWAWIKHFRQTNGFVFNGSDPLPIAGEIQRVASYGIRIEAQVKSALNSQMMIALLKDDSVTKRNYGKSLGLIAFIKGRFALAKFS